MIPSISSFLLLSLSGVVLTLDFPSYQSVGSYKCGQYKRGRVEDRALGQYYHGIRQVIGWISHTFPHQELLTDEALLGDQQEWIDSFEKKYSQWLQFEEGNVAVVAGILSISIAFPIVYILIRCISACCKAVSKEKQALASAEEPWDGCKRHFLNILLIIFVLIDVFAASALLVTGQYAEYGLEQLPGRMNQCIDDLNLYKRDTDGQIRKLLINDWSLLNASLLTQMNGSGAMVVDRVKKVTGAHGIDVFINVSQEARKIQTVLLDVQQHYTQVKDDANKFIVDFGRMKKSLDTEITGCLDGQIDEKYKDMCRQAQALLDDFNKIDVNLDTSIMGNFDQSTLDRFLLTNVTNLLDSSNSHFVELSEQIQHEIDSRTRNAKDVLDKIGSDLFVIAEQASAKIRQVDLDPLYSAVATYTDNKEVNIVQYVKWSWYASLLITGIFILLSLAFLFGLFYGLCGRGNSFYNDDCCTRSTGSRFYSCGIWLSILFFTILSIFGAALFFVFSNTTHLLCDPLERPLSRPDIITLGDRYIELFTRDNNSDMTKMIRERNLAEIIRGCGRNETFYSLFDMDSLYHLNALEDHEREALTKFDSTLSTMVDQMNINERMGDFLPTDLLRQLESLNGVNVSRLSADALLKIQQAIDYLDKYNRVDDFIKTPLTKEQPEVLGMIVARLTDMYADMVQPLRTKLEMLQSNMTTLDGRLKELQVPVDSLLAKLQHAQVLLSEDVRTHVIAAAREVIEQMKSSCDDYIKHVKREIQQETSSCTPVAQTIVDARDAVCHYTIDPINGSWMSMLICLAVTIPIIIICTSLISLYNKIMTYPKYAHEPMHDHFVSSFITDTYDTRRKPVHALPPGHNYSNYSYAGEYHTPYLR